MSLSPHGFVILTNTLIKMGGFLVVISFIVVFIALFYVYSHLSLYDQEYVFAPIMFRLVCFYIFRFYIMAYHMVKIDSRWDKDG